VYSEARNSSDALRTLKKGDALFVDLELKLGPEKWCSVRLPGESARIGYVECDGLERTDRRSGDLALPADASPISGAPSGIAGAAKPSPIHLPRARLNVESTSEYERVAAAVVHDDILDGTKIAEFEQAARSGSAAAMTRAAMAHDAAGNFELAHNDSDQAIEEFRAAVPFAAKQPTVLFGTLISLSYVHLVRSEYSAALETLDEAKRVSPSSAAVNQLSGWAYYGLNRLDEAIKEWEAAQRIQPNPQIAALLEKARRDKSVEQETRQGQTTHFVLHDQGGATPQLANEILRVLEEHFRSLQNDLHFTPPESIGVILYTQQAFRDITRAPNWAGALNDGRIRVPVQGLDSVTDDLSRVLKHELTHSFVHQMTLGRCPTWLNEGLAQWMEGRRSADSAKILIDAFDRGAFPPLKRLEGSWTQFPAPAAALAYAWSLAAVECVMAKSGPLTINRLLTNLSKASSTEDALREALQIGYTDLDAQTAEYLRQNYEQ
jgi:tetratricopeptide (TPR) repeat protein